MKILHTVATIGLAASLAVPPAAAAQQERVVTGRVDGGSDGRQFASAVVPFGDLDLGSRGGVRALNDRVFSAATRLCMDGYLQPLALRQAGTICRAEAIAGAQDQIATAISRRSSLAGAAVTLVARR